MVVQGPLDFNILLGRDYVYVMGALVSSLFRVVCFPHEGRIVTIDQLSFIVHQVPPLQPLSPIGSCLQPVPSLPLVNYAATRSISAFVNDHTDGIVHYVLGALELDLSNGFLATYPFQSIVLPSDENLLEVMTSYGS